MVLEELEDLDLEVSEEDVPDPDEAGPSAAGKTPAIGTLRRKNGIPVLRDNVPNIKEEI